MLPIIVMMAYTFFTFVTAGVETSALTLANWQEFLIDTYYHGFLWKTVRVGAMTAIALRADRLFSRLLHLVDDASGTNGCCCCCSSCRSGSASPSAPSPGSTFSANRASSTWCCCALGVINEPMPMLYTEGAVIMGLLHFLLPYMILNVYVSLESIDRTLISAARSMGCTSAQAFREVTLPLSLPGLGAGLLLCFVLAAGSYVTPQIARRQPRRAVRQSDLRHDHEPAQLADGRNAVDRAVRPARLLRRRSTPATWACRRS